MATITIENVPENIVKLYGTRIKYTRDFIFPKKKEKDVEDMTLLEYINSDEYKNEERKYYSDPMEFLSDLKKWI